VWCSLYFKFGVCCEELNPLMETRSTRICSGARFLSHTAMAPRRKSRGRNALSMPILYVAWHEKSARTTLAPTTEATTTRSKRREQRSDLHPALSL
jgi:hypothetical protein